MYFVYRYVGFTIHIKETGKSIVAAIVMGGVVLLVYDNIMLRIFHNTIATILAIGAGGFVYGMTLLFLGGVGQRDIEKIPKFGARLSTIIRKLGFWRK